MSRLTPLFKGTISGAVKTCAELFHEILELRRRQVEDLANFGFGCWTCEEEAEHRKRSEYLSLLILELGMARDASRFQFPS